MNYEGLLRAANDAALAAGQVLREEFHYPGGPRGGHGHADADGQAEAIIRRKLSDAAPRFGQRGEELREQDRSPDAGETHIWLIDPNDGTSAFLKGWRGAAVSIALVANGLPVLGVVYAYGHPNDHGDLI